MSPTPVAQTALVLRARASTRGEETNPYPARVKHLVRYADPMAWAWVLAIGQATEQLGEPFRSAVERCSLIQVGPEAPPEAMTQTANDTLRGFASPLRFPAATPSAPTGLACIVHGIRGPTLALTMPVAEGAGIALALSAAWLTRGVVDYALIGTSASQRHGAPYAACVVLTRGEGPTVDPALLVKSLLPERCAHD
ncbi:coronafacic acid synthetase [Comamonas sp. JC664]|uniref:coronafacic acid synthetase n=1 Tax=Comamonas sp. JC664 TaxID=2801917 RepID=UPI00174CB588|nr:coronafacic acid synthetase [Comamonas sp. JC664]MBL0693568.1 hypothetical protein [Comamonas sp. JC664]GHG73231.1 hypothetical protein GCM10012319_19900 [Comamonas sp. KCTC 72670]